MKILYVGSNRERAQAAAGALRHLGPDVAFTWADCFSDALAWLRDNRDLTAAIVEDVIRGEHCDGFVSDVRRIGLTAPMVIASTFGDADNLPAALARALREPEAQPVAPVTDDWEQAVTDIHQRVRQLQNERDALRRSLEAMRDHLQDMERVRAREQAKSADERERLTSVISSRERLLHESRAAARRQFEQTARPLLHCNREGQVEEVNRAFVTLLGFQPEDERPGDDLAAVFESQDDLKWLVTHCLGTGATESVETRLRGQEGRPLVVRLSARPDATGTIEVVVDDLTSLRTAEDKLRQAERMEAVGRLASEVASTCDTLLRDVSQGGQQWLSTLATETSVRHQGEHLLDEVTRAASFLRQLVVYGNDQANAIGPVDVHKVLRELSSVLKRLAGEDIDLVLPKSKSPMLVDVDAERVERILVNLAAYGRERLPAGGRLTIEVAAATVDREFMARHPNVRSGSHALLTVTGVRYAERWDRSVVVRGDVRGDARGRNNADTEERPGVDLGAVQALVSDCGGHLWMTAEPQGDMVLKIYLPLGALEGVAGARASRSERGGMSRWFRV